MVNFSDNIVLSHLNYEIYVLTVLNGLVFISESFQWYNLNIFLNLIYYIDSRSQQIVISE